LESLKQSLNETIATQKDALADLKEKAEQCAADLEAARAEAKAAAAKKRAKEKKPTAVREAEKKGTPKSGTRSRY
jgi:flagellar biosynthesis chaperone FliJ